MLMKMLDKKAIKRSKLDVNGDGNITPVDALMVIDVVIENTRARTAEIAQTVRLEGESSNSTTAALDVDDLYRRKR